MVVEADLKGGTLLVNRFPAIRCWRVLILRFTAFALVVLGDEGRTEVWWADVPPQQDQRFGAALGTPSGVADRASFAKAAAEQRRREALLKTGALQNAILTSARFSIIATDEKGIILRSSAPIVQAFVGQPLPNLTKWMRQIGGFRFDRLWRNVQLEEDAPPEPR